MGDSTISLISKLDKLRRVNSPHPFKPKVPPLKVLTTFQRDSIEILFCLPPLKPIIMEEVFDLPRLNDEDQDSYDIRNAYANTALLYYGDTMAEEEAVKLGFMAVNKIRYGVSYEDKYERLLFDVSQLVEAD